MNESVTLVANVRNESGKGSARRLRRGGRVPAVVYGRRDDTESLAVDSLELSRLLSQVHAATTVIDLVVDGGDPRPVIIREIQRHPVRPDVQHVDFFEIRSDVKIRVRIPVHVEGTAHGVEMGGILQQLRHEIEIECLPRNIPSGFAVDVSGLEIGGSIHIRDVDTADVEVLDDAGLTVCSVVPPIVEATDEDDEALAEAETPTEEAGEGAGEDVQG